MKFVTREEEDLRVTLKSGMVLSCGPNTYLLSQSIHPSENWSLIVISTHGTPSPRNSHRLIYTFSEEKMVNYLNDNNFEVTDLYLTTRF